MATSPCPDVSMLVPNVVLLPKSCREVSSATSSPFVGLYLGDLWPYRLQSTTTKCVFMRTIQPIQLNGSIQHEALEAAGATPFCLSFQCIKLPPVMTSHVNYDVLHSFPLIRNWSICKCDIRRNYHLQVRVHVFARVRTQELGVFLLDSRKH